jgi:hypothetical protein
MLMIQRLFLTFWFVLGLAAPALSSDVDDTLGITPPRLSYIDGDISYLRPGADEWDSALLNTPVAVGDEIYAGDKAGFELQTDARAFVRADERTRLALVNQTPGFLQFRVTAGHVSLDLRELGPGMTIEMATPDAVFRINHEGYYRLDVGDDTQFISRRGGIATVIPAGGQAFMIQPSEEIVVRSGNPVQVETYVAPELDQWDRWNYARSDDLLDAVSARYLPPGVYGANDLDNNGTWRVVADYGPVWIPDRVSDGWAPYSTGIWVWDPVFEWTWIDDAPWGWAPFHYGRWVSINGIWAWAPGPVVRQRPPYSPALVAFFSSGDHVSRGIGISTPGLFWVSLSWGEPVIPWWGRQEFRGKPWWGGWHGPRVVNDTTYRNAGQHNAVAFAARDRFGRPDDHVRQVDRFQWREMDRVKGALPVRPGPESVSFGVRKGVQPSPEVDKRPVVVTRPPQEVRQPWQSQGQQTRQSLQVPFKVVPSPKPNGPALSRPEYGQQGAGERPRPAPLPRYRELRQQQDAMPVQRGDVQPKTELKPIRPATPVVREVQPAREMPRTREVQPPPVMRRDAAGQPPARAETPQNRVRDERRDLPGKPANRMYRGGEKDDQGNGPDRRDH